MTNMQCEVYVDSLYIFNIKRNKRKATYLVCGLRLEEIGNRALEYVIDKS